MKCRSNFLSKSILDRYADKIELGDINPSDTDGVDSDHESTLNRRLFLRSQAVAYNAKKNTTRYATLGRRMVNCP